MNRFWNWVKNEAEPAEPAELRLNGAIAEESWLEDDVTPAQFRAELEAHPGDVTVWINSPGGCVFAASQIYTMLRNHNGKITVKIDGIAASAASVVAMAGDETLISPTGMLMIHDPMTLAYGNKADMEQTITMLEEVKESILNAYVQRVPPEPGNALAADERRNVDECRKSLGTGTGGRNFICGLPCSIHADRTTARAVFRKAYPEHLVAQTFRSRSHRDSH